MKTIEQMAEEAGIEVKQDNGLFCAGGDERCSREDLQRFAALVAERCAQLCLTGDAVQQREPVFALERAADSILAAFPKP